MYRLLAIFVVLTFSQLCFGGTVLVPSEQPTIQAGIDAAITGDTVLVESGTYTGAGNRDISFGGKDIVVISESGPETAIIDLQASQSEPHRAFNFLNGETSAAEVAGFTIINGYGTFSHSHNEGGAMLIENASPTIKYCVFADNIGDHQGGAVSCFTSSPTFINCTFVGNGATFGGGVYSNGASPVLENCILAFNAGGGAVNCIYGGTVSLTCCDLYGNGGGDYVSCASGQEGIYGNISEDPIFADLTAKDYTVKIYSPCSPYINTECGLIGALGPDEYVLPVAVDINYGTGGNIVPSLTPEIYWTYFDTATASQTGYEIEVGTDDDWSVAEMWSTGQVTSPDTSVVYAGSPLSDVTTYYLRIRVNNGRGWGDWRENWFSTYMSAIVLHVPSEFPTIQAAVDAAGDFDTVMVAPGTYTGEGNRDIDFYGKLIIVKSEDGAETTILDCQGSQSSPHRAFRFTNGEANTAIVEGFTITNGYGPFESDDNKGGGIYCNVSSPSIIDCIFDDNIGRRNGGAISGWNSSPMVTGCVFRNNRAIHGAAIYLNGIVDKDKLPVAEFSNCLFEDNVGLAEDYSYGGAILIQYGGQVLNLNNCIFYNNMAEIGGAIVCWTDATINLLNCSVVANKSNYHVGGGIYALEGATVNIENSIIAFSKGGNAVFCDGAVYTDITCTNIYGNAGGDWDGCIATKADDRSNISLDPLFCNAATGDLTLFNNSPCLPPNNDCGVLIGALGEGCSGYINQVWKVDADGSADFETIQEAIDASQSGDTVIVYAGIYFGEGNRDLDFWGKQIVVMSNSGPYSTLIDCEGSQGDPHRAFRLVNAETPSAVIDGFSITNGYGPFEKDDSKGGGIYLANASPTINNCRFQNNTGRRNGGAISGWGSSPIVTYCTFTANSAIHGAAVYFNGVPSTWKNKALSNPVFSNCEFDSNVGLAETVSIGGAILIQYGNMTLELNNCVISNNTAEVGGAISCWGNPNDGSSTVLLNNCTISHNTANLDEGGGLLLVDDAIANIENSIIAFSQIGQAVYCYESPEGLRPSVSINCTDIYGNAGGDWVDCLAPYVGINGNFSLDPEFCYSSIEDYTLWKTSPCAPDYNECQILIGALDVGCRCGDANADGNVAVSDAIWIINYVFVSGSSPDPYRAGDTNCDGTVNVSDALWIINYVFVGGKDPCDTDGDGTEDC